MVKTYQPSPFPTDLREPDLLIALLQQVPDGVVLTNAASEIVWANAAYCALMGCRLDEVVGRTPKAFRSSRTDQGTIDDLWDGLAYAGRAETRLVDRRTDGSEFHASLSIVRIESGPGGVPHYLGLLRDVSLQAAHESRLRELAADSDAARDVTIMALASMAEERDGNTGRHLQRVEAYCLSMARWLVEHAPQRLPAHARDPETIARCAILHDIGKVGIPDAVLRKPGKLDAVERDVMQQHPVIGAKMLGRVLELQPGSDFLRIARDVVLHHHEAFDGSGYPYGLSGDAIPAVAALTTVADVFDALTSARPYKAAHTFEDSARWIGERSATLFDPLIVRAFVAVQDEIRQAHERLADPGAVSERPIALSSMRSPHPVRIRAPSSTLSEALQHAAQAVRNDETLGATLRAMVDSGLSGELRVRCGEAQGRVDIADGSVLWVHGCGEHPTLGARLVRDGLIDSQALAETVALCKRSGQLLSDALIQRDEIEAAALRAAIARHLASKLDALGASPGECVVTFASGPAATTSFAYRLEELR